MDLDQIFDKLPPKLSLGKTAWQKIEPEEVFLDARKDRQHKMEEPIKKRNFLLFYALVLVSLFGLVLEAGWLQIFNGKFYRVQAEKNRLRIMPIFAPRGIIYAQDGEQLVYNAPIFNLVAVPAYLPKEKIEREEIIEKAAGILGIDKKEISGILLKKDLFSFEPVILAEDIPLEKILLWETSSQKLSGFSLEKNIRREYVDGQYFSQILGYVGQISEEEYKNRQNYFLTETLGKSGLEFQYQDILRTPPGKKETEVNARGEIKKTGTIEESKDIKNLLLSVNSNLQRQIYEQLSNAMRSTGAEKAAVVVIDPRDGRILALVSFPSFDNNLLAKGINKENYKKFFDLESQPMFNRAIAGQYAPGSTIKPFIASAALEEEIINPNMVINDTGTITIANPYNPDIVYKFPDWKTHGPVNIYSAIAQSCDIYFYTIGGGHGDFNGLGIDRLEKYLKLFGLGKLTGIDLPNEKSGFVPNEKWKEETKKEDWYIGDTYHLSIGQGDLITTPLQIAVLTAAIANNGTIWQPQVVDKIIDSKKNVIDDIKPSGKAIDFISSKNIGIIREAMRQTILSGSAQYLKDLPVEVAGKTGTAQTFAGIQTNAWFTAFAPFNNPEIAITILIEEGGEGSGAAVPVAKEILKWYFNRQNRE